MVGVQFKRRSKIIPGRSRSLSPSWPKQSSVKGSQKSGYPKRDVDKTYVRYLRLFVSISCLAASLDQANPITSHDDILVNVYSIVSRTTVKSSM